jgi:UDP-glucose 4-epimerase
MDAIRLVEKLAGKKANLEFKPRHPTDVPVTWADIGKAKRLLALRPGSPLPSVGDSLRSQGRAGGRRLGSGRAWPS